MIDFVAKNCGHVIGSFLLLLLGTALTGKGLDVVGRQQQMALKAIEQARVDTWLAEQSVGTASAQAEQRYKSGCVVVDRQIVEGLTVGNLQPGEAICGRDGITAIVGSNGQVKQIARTSNEMVITERLSRL